LGDWLSCGVSPKSSRYSSRVPRVNINDHDDKISIIAEMPGIDEKDLDVSVENGILSIKTQTESKEESEDKTSYREFHFGRYERKFTLPENVDEENIVAKYRNGILELDIPREKKKPAKKVIKIFTG